jgi:hypothetical protein
VLVPTTQTKHFAHAAIQLSKRPSFTPKAMYSDTWPNKSSFWESVLPGIEGRLGLFHYEKRIISTLRKKHIDYFDALTDLLLALYSYEASDYEKLLTALKDGSLSGKRYSSHEIAEMKMTKTFRERYGKYLRKKLNEPQTIIQRLDDWFQRYKVSSSDPNNQPARGRLDPLRGICLFTPETKAAVENCKAKALYLADPLPLEQMYEAIPPNPNSPHQLTEYLSNRGESKLESFHDRFAHFANGNMRASLADNLNLAGTAHYNLSIRHKRGLTKLANAPEKRRRIPTAWERVLPYFNHSGLWYVNGLAASVGAPIPFPTAERLPEDNGERFFSEYLTTQLPALKTFDVNNCCLCQLCHPSILTVSRVPPQLESPNTLNQLQVSINKPTNLLPITTTCTQSLPSPPDENLCQSLHQVLLQLSSLHRHHPQHKLLALPPSFLLIQWLFIHNPCFPCITLHHDYHVAASMQTGYGGELVDHLMMSIVSQKHSNDDGTTPGWERTRKNEKRIDVCIVAKIL